MNVYDIWGQNDEENLDHGSTYSIMEEQNVEADSPKEAVQKLVLGYVQEAMRDSKPLAELLPPPANGDHWHFKVIDAMDSGNVTEFAARFHMLPAVEVGELRPPEPTDPKTLL